MTRQLGLLLVVSLVAGLLTSLLQGVLPRDLASDLYVLLMGLVPFLLSQLLTGAAAGLQRISRHRALPRPRLVLWGTWLLGNLLLLLDQHLAH